MPSWGWALIGILAPVGTAMIGMLWRAGYKLGRMDQKLDNLSIWQIDHDAEHIADEYGYRPRPKRRRRHGG